MSLISLWNSNKEDIESKQIQQLVALAGDGKLKDGSDCCNEIREYFSQIEVDLLGLYIEQILNSSFDKSGYVLQDAINEIGRRLDFQVEDGLYKGIKGQIGHDGLWTSPDRFSIVIEVKTTDTYRINLDTAADYRSRLIGEDKISNNSSILFVVGRKDTGDLEAQVRGSRHAWDVRIISAEALVSLARIKLNTEEDTGEKMRMLLRPIEYTRLDALVDIVYTTSQDMDEDSNDIVKSDLGSLKFTTILAPIYKFTDSRVLDAKREHIIKRFSKLKGKTLIKKTRATYWSSDHSLRVGCTISKPYEREAQRYWYAYHPKWDAFLDAGDDSYLILGCMDLDSAFAIPRSDLIKVIDKLNITEKKDGSHYWHLQIAERSGNKYELSLPKEASYLDISKYSFNLTG